ncbi:hypothetical protein ACF0H5_010863 [Mactra antiquata]
MDSDLLSSFGGKIVKLKGQSEDLKQDNTIPCELIQDDAYCYYVHEKTNVPSDRFTRLKEIIDVKAPFILVCRSEGFFLAPEKLDNNDNENSLNFVTARKKSSRSSKTSSNGDQSTMCGSPLKLDIIADLSVFDGDSTSGASVHVDNSYTLKFGLKLHKARKILSMYSHLFSSLKIEGAGDKIIESPTLITICDGENINSVSSMSLEPLFDKVNNFLGVKITETRSEPADTKICHMKRSSKFSSGEVLCSAKYDIFSENVTGGVSQIDAQGLLSLELEWKKKAGESLVPLHDPPLDSKAKVNVQVTSGDIRSSAFTLYQELEILGSIIEGLTTRQVNWIGTPEHPLIDSVENLVEQLKVGHDIADCKLETTTTVDEYNIRFDCGLIEDRKDLDFTDLLWKILQNCTSSADLVEAFNYIILELRKGDLQPRIHTHNVTTIGQTVRDSYRGQMRAPNMSHTAPLIYLAEIGCQKLTQDYIQAFLNGNLVSMSHFDYYLAGNLELEDKLLRLQKLHNALEMIILLKQCLHLPHVNLSECCQFMLKHYEIHAIDPNHHFTFDVPTSCLSNAIQNFPATEWKAKGVKLVANISERLVYHFTVDPPFDWLKIKTDERKSNTSSDDHEVLYHLTIVKDSVSILS